MTDNLAIWRSVEKTDPNHTKKVNQRGGFTAISAHYQVMAATQQFGPVGIGWGYENGEPIWHENLVIVPVTLWHGDRSNRFGPVYGGAEWKSSKGHIDSDGPKKAATDGLTKALSHLGFSADVFLGRFDDNKYVEGLRREFSDDPPISDDQHTKLMQLIPAAKVKPAQFNQKFGISRTDELPSSKFDEAVESLKARMAELAKRETDTQAKEAA